MERFVYAEGDLELGDSQCSLCIHFDSERIECELVGKISPDIINDVITCDKFEYEDELN